MSRSVHIYRVYGIRPDFCIALRLIAMQEYYRRQENIVPLIIADFTIDEEDE